MKLITREIDNAVRALVYLADKGKSRIVPNGARQGAKRHETVSKKDHAGTGKS